MSKLTLLVMAAGMGKRFGGLKKKEAVGPAGGGITENLGYGALAAGIV